MTTQELLAEQIERIGDSMAYFIETTPPDVLPWRPEIPRSAETRSILEMVAECVLINRQLATRLKLKDAEGIQEQILADANEAVQQIQESARDLAAVIRSVPAEALDALYSHRTGHQFSGLYLIVGAYRNMAYHSGQINLIQMLKGDGEFHRPQAWYGKAR